MSFGDLKTESGVKALNGFLEDKSYIEGYVFLYFSILYIRSAGLIANCGICSYTPSQADVETFKALGKAPSSNYPHALRWYNHIKSFGDNTSSFPGAKAAAAPAKPAAAPAKDDDDDLDLFGSDEVN